MLAHSKNGTPCPWRRRIVVGAFAAFLFPLGCAGEKPDAPEPTVELSKPAALETKVTTDAAATVANIEGIIESRRALIEKTTSPAAISRARRELVSAHLNAARFLGRIESFDHALAVSQTMLDAKGERPDRFLIRARVLAALHRWSEAEAALESAAVAGVSQSALALPRTRLALGRGNVSEALASLRKLVSERDDLAVRSSLAVALADAGELAEADHLFAEVIAMPTLFEPARVATLEFRRGLSWEREGKRARAREIYRAAAKRFPIPPLVAHLAALEAEAGDVAGAISRLEALPESVSDPEIDALLAELYERTGDHTRSQELAAKAKRGYDALLTRHPAAFADHAARFFLAAGEDSKRAYELAALNLKNRSTDDAFALALDAARAAKRPACDVATAASSRAYASAYVLFMSASSLRQCGNIGAADTTLARAGKARRSR